MVIKYDDELLRIMVKDKDDGDQKELDDKDRGP